MKIRAGVRELIVFPLYLLPCRERVTVLCRAPRCVFVCVCVCLCVYSRVGASCVGRRMCVCVVSAPLRRVNTSHRWSVGTFPFWPLFPLVNPTTTIISPPRALTPRTQLWRNRVPGIHTCRLPWTSTRPWTRCRMVLRTRALGSLTTQPRRSTTSSSIPTCTRRVAAACTCLRARHPPRPPRHARSATGWKRVCSFGRTRTAHCT